MTALSHIAAIESDGAIVRNGYCSRLDSLY